jgi:hypothetical protein
VQHQHGVAVALHFDGHPVHVNRAGHATDNR